MADRRYEMVVGGCREWRPDAAQAAGLRDRGTREHRELDGYVYVPARMGRDAVAAGPANTCASRVTWVSRAVEISLIVVPCFSVTYGISNAAFSQEFETCLFRLFAEKAWHLTEQPDGNTVPGRSGLDQILHRHARGDHRQHVLLIGHLHVQHVRARRSRSSRARASTSSRSSRVT